MIAYNRTNLDNLYTRGQAKEAFTSGCISGEENTKIGAAYPVDLYTPNIFICVGLFLLTIVIAACSLGLFLLISAGNSESFTPLLIVFGLICYGALEYVVHNRRHFKSGVDYALMWMSAGLIYAGIFFAVNNASITAQCITVFAISLLFTLRFGNFIMALLACAALLVFIVHIVMGFNRAVQLLAPFIIMAFSIGLWLLSLRLDNYKKYRHYRASITALKVAALTSFYIAGNYFVVREMSGYMFGPSQNGGDISMGWLFWILTVALPLFYIYQGIRKKDALFLWTGLALIVATVFTVRYYYSVMPVEWALVIGGIVMITISYGLIRYLKTPKHGFTSEENGRKHLLENLHLESLVIAETFAGAGAVKAPANDFQFGGGSGGGGGAGGQY
jgi:hypothetical protein